MPPPTSTTSGAAAHLGLVRCGRVINPAAFETFATFHAEAAILGAGGDKQALGDDGLAAFQSENGVGLVEAQLDHGRGNGDARAELVRLQDGAIGQFAAGNAGGKSQIIFDPHAAAGLAARRRAFQDDRVQSFGGAIDRGGQPRRSRADDGEIVNHLFHRPADADLLGQLAVRGVAQKQHARAGDDRRVGFGYAKLFK